MDAGSQEYEVESVTRARVHDKKGKKITWKYYVKWKGYGWDESTWEPTDSFQDGSEHILEAFWERMDTGGRDISDATAFKKGEELLISGPPGRKSLKRKANPQRTQGSISVDIPSSNGATASAPPLPRKWRRVQVVVGDDWGSSRRRASAGVPKKGKASTKSSKRRRVSSPGPQKSASKRLPSAGDSQLDADGETDPDVVEVEDELMQVSGEDGEADPTQERHQAAASETLNGSKEIIFDDLEHFYSGNPIEIDQNADEQAGIQKTRVQSRPRSSLPPPSPPLDDTATKSQAPASPAISSYDPLFDSPSRPSDKAPEAPVESVLPHHRVRTTKPLVKLIDPTTHEGTSKESRITTKARLMSLHRTDMPSISGSSGNVAKRRGKPGPGRSSAGLNIKNRSSLLTATKGSLKSVKGKFANALERDQPDEIEEVPDAGGTTEGDKLVITSWSDEDAVIDCDHQATSSLQPGPPSGDELLRLAGLKTDPEPLPDYEDEPTAQPQETEEMRDVVSASVEESSNQSSVEAAVEPKADDRTADASPSMFEVGQQPPTPVVDSPSVSSVVDPPVDEAVKKNIELAKERLFPSTQTPFGSFSTAQSSFRSTIFGPLYQGSTANCFPAAKNEFSTRFKVILGDGVELPLVLDDCSEIKARISDILIGSSSGSKVALFYAAEDALAMVSTFKSDGTARVVLDHSAEAVQRERFSAFLGRFQSSHTLIAPVGTEVCVLYSSENADVAEKLGTPTHLRGLSSTLLVSHASIENQPGYVGAIMRSSPL